MLCEMRVNMEPELYRYFVSTRRSVPYYFPVSFTDWHESMFHDCDYDGSPLFSHLETHLLINNNRIEGFIQFGLTSFVFGVHGKKDDSNQYAVIRNIYFSEDATKPQLLLDKAEEYFDGLGHKRKYAYFHYFGMSCYARQGKLHASEFYIENLLSQYGYIKEHENIYYSRSLRTVISSDISEIDFLHSINGQSISFIKNSETIGGCEIAFLPHSDACFLRWIYIDDTYSHQGLGQKCMRKLFYELHKKGVSRFDTDTADSNIRAQNYYLKTGFSDLGRMRSYCTK